VCRKPISRRVDAASGKVELDWLKKGSGLSLSG